MVGGAFIAHCGVHAMPTKSVLERLETDDIPKYEDFSEREDLTRIIKSAKDFIRTENKKDLSFYDNARERADSLAFSFFCYLCLKENAESFGDLVDKAIGMRDVPEHNEDIIVIDYIFPQNADEFTERFGLELDEIIRFELSKRIHQWRFDPGTILRVSESTTKYYLDQSRRRKPNRKFREQLKYGVSEYNGEGDGSSSDTEDYSDCESE